MPPVVVRTCYDGDHFGEMLNFTARMQPKKKVEETEEEIIKSSVRKATQKEEHGSTGFLAKDRYMDEEEMKDLSAEEVNVLNQQRTTATTIETCDFLYIRKDVSMAIIKKGMEGLEFTERAEFLAGLKLFKRINRNHL